MGLQFTDVADWASVRQSSRHTSAVAPKKDVAGICSVHVVAVTPVASGVGPTAVPTLKNYMPDATLELDGDVSSMTPAMLQKAKMAIAEHMGIPVEEVEIGVNAGSVTVAMKIHRDDGNPMAKKFADDVRSGKIDIGNFFEGFSLAGSGSWAQLLPKDLRHVLQISCYDPSRVVDGPMSRDR